MTEPQRLLRELRTVTRRAASAELEWERLRFLNERARTLRSRQRRSLAARLRHAEERMRSWRSYRIQREANLRWWRSASHQMLLAAGCVGNHSTRTRHGADGSYVVELCSYGTIAGTFIGRGSTSDDACRDIIRQIALRALER